MSLGGSNGGGASKRGGDRRPVDERSSERRDPDCPDKVELIGDAAALGLSTTELCSWADEVLGAIAPEFDSLAISLVDGDAIQELNRRYRALDATTDVLSFPGDETPEGRHLGDLAISLEAVKQQSVDAGHDHERELKELILHGILHCLGYDHEEDDGEMDRRELELRTEWIRHD